MKKILVAVFALLLAASTGLWAQNGTAYTFKPFKQLAATPVKDQQQTGTCWAFSGASFLESEVKRLNGFEVDLSEMYVVRHIYRQKCENFVRRQGSAQLGEGGLAHDVFNAVRQYGIVPESVYPGRKDPSKPLNHGSLEKELREVCKKYVELGKKGELPADFMKEIDVMLDEEFGAVPRKFAVDGRAYTPSLYRDYLGINPDNYVTITSFTHHPFYQSFILEIPDNFANGAMYNLPLDDMMRSLNYSVQQGYTVQWDADVSNEGFSPKNAIALVPEVKMSDKNEAERSNTFKMREPQKKVTQEYRQELFDRQITMDDHLMHITGIETEANTSDIYYTVKNSWGEISDLKGYFRASEAYMRLNTISFLVHKNALPSDIRQRLGFESGDAAIETAPMKTETPMKKDAPMKKGPVKVQKQAPAAKQMKNTEKE